MKNTENTSKVVVDWNQEVDLKVTFKDLFLIRLALGQANNTVYEEALSEVRDWGALPECLDGADLKDALYEQSTFEIILEKFGKIAPTYTYKEYEQKQYKVSYKTTYNDQMHFGLYLNANDAIGAYKSIVDSYNTGSITDLKLETVSVKSKVKFSDVDDVDNLIK